MVIKGNSRRAAAFWSKHLMNVEENEQVRVVEMKGLYADDVKEALREMRLLAAGTKAENPYYIVSMNPREDEALTPEQWEQATDTLEHNLGLDGHARCVVEHEKEGRVHRHIVFSRVDVDTMTVVPTNNNYLIHTATARELERMFGHAPTPVPPHPERDRFKDWETFRAQESGIDPKAMKAEITGLFHASDSGTAFQSALEHSGYTLCRGDKQGVLCLVDSAGDSHALLRRIDGLKAAELRAFMADVDAQQLPSVAEAIQLVKAEEENSGGSSAARTLPEEQRRAEPDPRTAPLEQLFPDALPHVADLRERTNQFEAQWFQHLGSLSADEWAHQIGDNERAWQHCFGHSEAARKLDKTTEPPAQDFEPVQPPSLPFSKQPHESWSQFVTRTQPPDRQLTIDTPDEPERER
jgi:hypothetical protein